VLDKVALHVSCERNRATEAKRAQFQEIKREITEPAVLNAEFRCAASPAQVIHHYIRMAPWLLPHFARIRSAENDPGQLIPRCHTPRSGAGALPRAQFALPSITPVQ
jgi:hypothetical protein